MELARAVRLGWHMVRVAQPRAFKRPSVLVIRPVTDSVLLEVVTSSERRCTTSVTDSKSLLVAGVHEFEVTARTGAWRYQRIPLSLLAKLLAFIEAGFAMPASAGERGTVSLIEVPGGLSADHIERWMVERAIERDGQMAALFELLRANESYGLVRFLLAERLSFKSVTDLSRQYGVSESHFRRLCRQALGTSLKGELRRWRAAGVVLGIVDERKSLTELAIGSGFSSSSHLSKEVKDFLGISPCKIRQGQ